MKIFLSLKKHMPLGLAALAGVFLLTTGFENHQMQTLKSVSAELLPSFSLQEIKVVVHAKAMTPDESKRNFGHDLISRDVQPLQQYGNNSRASGSC